MTPLGTEEEMRTKDGRTQYVEAHAFLRLKKARLGDRKPRG